MSWSPNDLVTDTDLVAYERQILEQFGAGDWLDRRQKALEDWLFPLLSSRGFNPDRLRTRVEPNAVLGYTSSTFSDQTSAAATEDGLVLSTILATSSDRLYVGSKSAFRGLSVRQLDSVNAVSATMSLQAWADTWSSVGPASNATVSGTAPFAKGGPITWDLPESLVRRSVNDVGPYYWVRLGLSAAPTSGTKIGPLLVIRRSRLCAAVTFRTLCLIFREAPTGQDGPWSDKAAWYEKEAEQAWLRVVDHIGGEFDTDDSDAISEDEADQTADTASGGGWRWERA